MHDRGVFVETSGRVNNNSLESSSGGVLRSKQFGAEGKTDGSTARDRWRRTNPFLSQESLNTFTPPAIP